MLLIILGGQKILSKKYIHTKKLAKLKKNQLDFSLTEVE